VGKNFLNSEFATTSREALHDISYSWPEVKRLFERIQAAPPTICEIYASTSFLRQLSSNNVSVVDIEQARVHGVPVTHRPELPDGFYALRMSDGSIGFPKSE
jgi:hypothetical protein